MGVHDDVASISKKVTYNRGRFAATKIPTRTMVAERGRNVQSGHSSQPQRAECIRVLLN